jgi:exodeoxyribonuclease V alpha subunit
MSATAGTGERDPFDPRVARQASGLLREFNRAGVISAADVHVARRLGELGGERDQSVLLAVALAVRAPRLGHVHVDLAQIRETAAVDTEDPVDLGTLTWPSPAAWVEAVARSALVGTEGDEDAGVRPLRRREAWLYLDRYWSEEVALAGALRAMLDDEPPGVDAELLADGLARLFGDESGERQARAAAAAVRRRFAVVAGGPGTGKTTTVARIVALLCEQAARAGEAPPLVALAAPTGKAAARLQEAVQAQASTLAVDDGIRATLRELSASTIHRLLGWRAGTTSRFRHDRDRRLPHDVVIVDETSMVSLSLMARLIDALRADARLVLVGDPGQLASIEAGAVLGDIVGPAGDAAADGPTASTEDAGAIVVLHRGHRFGGGIAGLADAIRRGDAEGAIAQLRAGLDDVIWVARDAAGSEPPAIVRARAVTAAEAVTDAARAGATADALAALATFRILCAHRRGPYGVATWTARVEGWLGSDRERWYVGRPLLVTENDYELGLNNGDTGVVVQAGEGRVMAGFERRGEPVLYSPSRLGAVETVYAMTIHKSQGSQFDAVAVLLPDPGSRLLTRELLYTAATRAQRQLIVVGGEEAVAAAVTRPVARASGLGWRLWGA